jgi:hypothetical protein
MTGIGTSATDACEWLNHYNATIKAMSAGVISPIQVIGGIATDWALVPSAPPRSSNSSSYVTCLSQCLSSCGANEGCIIAQSAQCNQQCTAQITCNGQGAPPDLQYNTAFKPTGHVFAESTFGNQSWDYNTMGAAHYGMLTDFLQDVSTLAGAPGSPNGAAVVSSIMNGAQCFYQTWRIAEKVAATVPAPCLPPNTEENCRNILMCLAPNEHCAPPH